MSRYIDADEYIARLSYYIEYLARKHGDDSNTVTKTLQTVIDEIDHLPTADVREVKHGKWIKMIDIGSVNWVKCSVCNSPFHEDLPFWEFDFCPNCGAKMDMKEEK